MPNLAAAAQNISASLSRVLTGVGRQLPKTGKDRLAEAIRVADQLQSILTAINAEVITLEEAPVDPGKEARNIWERLPAGIVKGNTRAFEQLRGRSETLSELYKAGIDITEIQKLSPEQIKISTRIGEDFARIHSVWDRFKFCAGKTDSPFETKVEFARETNRFFRILRDAGVVESYETRLFVFRDKTWVKRPVDKLHYASRANPVRFDFKMNRSYCALINGHWFNGYVYEVLRDQLDRMHVDYELYPLVRYTCGGNAALARGEFDILARIGRQRLVVECKSGRLQANGRDDLQTLIRTGEALEQRFAATRLARGLFILVYNPFLSPTAEVDQALAESDIQTIPITDMRGRVIDLVKELSAA